MKTTFLKYLPEVVVIVIGNTLSFIVDEIRQSRVKRNETITIRKSLLQELERNEEYLLFTDTTYLETEMLIKKYLENSEMTSEEYTTLFYELTEGLSTVRLAAISSFIHGFSSNDQLTIITKNKEVLTYITYLESLLGEHAQVTEELTNTAKGYWDALDQSGLTNLIINHQLEWTKDSDSSNFLHSKPNLDYLKSSRGIQVKMKWSYLKILSLHHINFWTHTHMMKLKGELNEMIQD